MNYTLIINIICLKLNYIEFKIIKNKTKRSHFKNGYKSRTRNRFRVKQNNSKNTSFT
jgi:hypothetical protein